MSRWASTLWVLIALTVTVLVGLQPAHRTVTPTYMEASHHWWTNRDLYHDGIDGFLYPPHFAILYTPFARAPAPLGDVLWRWLNLALFVSGLLRVARVVGAGTQAFGLISLLSIPACLSSARNGQVNMTEAALMLHAAVELARGRWWRASLVLAFGAALKPVPVAMALLAAAAWPPMLPRLAAACCAALVAPFAAGDFEYVSRQLEALVSKWSIAVVPDGEVFCDVNGLAARLGLELDAQKLAAVCGSVALLMLGLTVAVCRAARPRDGLRGRIGGQQGLAFFILALGAIQATVFNPRAETNGYVILAPTVAIFAALTWEAGSRRAVFWLLVVIALGLGADNYPLHRQTDFWLKPLLGLCFLGYLLQRMVAATTRPSPSDALSSAATARNSPSCARPVGA